MAHTLRCSFCFSIQLDWILSFVGMAIEYKHWVPNEIYFFNPHNLSAQFKRLENLDYISSNSKTWVIVYFSLCYSSCLLLPKRNFFSKLYRLFTLIDIYSKKMYCKIHQGTLFTVATNIVTHTGHEVSSYEWVAFNNPEKNSPAKKIIPILPS